jgi:sarcosine oxidase, subunit gamma
VVVLSARWARDLLTKGLASAPYPRAFLPGRCARTLLARERVILRRVEDRATYHVLVRGSFAPYPAVVGLRGGWVRANAED